MSAFVDELEKVAGLPSAYRGKGLFAPVVKASHPMSNRVLSKNLGAHAGRMKAVMNKKMKSGTDWLGKVPRFRKEFHDNVAAGKRAKAGKETEVHIFV